MALIIQFVCLLLLVVYRVSVTAVRSEKGVGSIIKKVVCAYSTTNHKRITFYPCVNPPDHILLDLKICSFTIIYFQMISPQKPSACTEGLCNQCAYPAVVMPQPHRIVFINNLTPFPLFLILSIETVFDVQKI